MPQYAGICVNMPKSAGWALLILTIVIRNGKTESPFLVTIFQRRLLPEGT